MDDQPADVRKWWDSYYQLNEEAEQVEAEIERLEVETRKMQIYEELRHINAQLEVCYAQRYGNEEHDPVLEARIRRLQRERRVLEDQIH